MRYVGIAAYSGPVPEHLVSAAEEFLEILGICYGVEDVAIVVGGYWGLMKYVVDHAIELGFKVIILPPLEMEDVRFPHDALVIRSGTSFRVRSVFLVRTSEVLVALGGAAGTMQEIVTAYTEGIPIYVLHNVGMPTDNVIKLGEYLDERKRARIHYIDNPKSLAEEICKFLKRTPPRGYAEV